MWAFLAGAGTFAVGVIFGQALSRSAMKDILELADNEEMFE